MSDRDWAPLVEVEVVSGTAQDGPGNFRGFVTVRALAEDGSHMAGQLSPAELRQMAMQFLEVAEAAEQDAIVMSMLVQDVELDREDAARFIMAMRGRRGHEMPDDG
jgi:hypothetical protein